MKIIPIKDAGKITNLESLARGTGARYLECIEPHREGLPPLIALRWRRKVPKKFKVLIDFEPEGS